MSLFSDSERAFAQTVARLTYCNPFQPDRIELERAALGEEFLADRSDWNRHVESEGGHPNIDRLLAKADAIVRMGRGRLAEGRKPAGDELGLIEDVALFLLYHRHRLDFPDALIRNPGDGDARVAGYAGFVRTAEHLLGGTSAHSLQELPHLYACYFQVRRAFHHIFSNIVGTSKAVARLRAAIWQSIFTHDIRRYRRVLFDRMRDFTTLITGPSGTGKELVAHAIGLSRYLPFDPETRRFAGEAGPMFQPLNLSALAPTVIESELFGHKRGAFTGALQDRAGWLETCPARGTVFLDEIGELSRELQVKLLRVLQERTFQRLGETETRQFHGKIIAATNRDLAQEMHAGRFREDFYYRLCSDLITTPSLQEQLRESPDELVALVTFIARRVAGESEAVALAAEVIKWIERELGRDYAWPGNFRELEQCVRNMLVRREYRPARRPPGDAFEELSRAVCAGTFTAEELLRRYSALVHAQTDNFEETARRLDLDRRTVKARLDPAMVEQFRR